MATTGGRPPSAPANRPSTVSGGQGVFDALKRWAVPIIGGLTPVALIVINIAVWINDHVTELALWVAIAAFVSGMMFNSWIGLNLYRWVQRRWPQWSPVTEQNQEVMLVVGMGLITVITFLTSLGLYLNLRDARGLPNALTLWYGVIQIAYPFLLKIYVDRDRRRRGQDERQDGITPGGSRTYDIQPQGVRTGGYALRTSRPIGPPPPPPPPGGGYLPPS